MGLFSPHSNLIRGCSPKSLSAAVRLSFLLSDLKLAIAGSPPAQPQPAGTAGGHLREGKGSQGYQEADERESQNIYCS